VGIPTLYIPYTADAPFMQKSNLPEGTVFIAVGAVLGFLGACVLMWRGMVAWSINRSVKRAALASIRGSEKNGGSSAWGGSTGYAPAKGALYKDVGSSLSLDALTSAGKPLKHDGKRDSTPPAGLFFSPTSQATPGHANNPNRNSSYLPAGYYASPNAQAAGGASSTTVGGGLAPYNRHSTLGPSPPTSPVIPPQSRGSTQYRASSRDGLRAPASRDGYNSVRNSFMDGTPRGGARNSTYGGSQHGFYMQPGDSSLMVDVGAHASGRSSGDNLPGSRAPSAYLDELFDNHGNGPRERF
jgi:hypothetical protein